MANHTEKKAKKYIFVTGGVVSGLGKVLQQLLSADSLRQEALR